MKKMIASVAAVLLIAGVAFAGSTNTVTNAVGQVFTVVIDNNGLHISGPGTSPGLPASASRTSVSALGYLLDSAHSTTNTIYVPRDIGDGLIGNLLGTGKVWVATGPTTNDWKALTSP